MWRFALLAAVLWPVLAFAASPTLDGHGNGVASAGTTITSAATTTLPNDIVIVGADVRNTDPDTTNPTPTIAGCGLTWTLIRPLYQSDNGSGTIGNAIGGWWAPTAGLLSACTITVTSNRTIGGAALAWCAFNGVASLASPFDPVAPVLTTNFSAANILEVGPLVTATSDALGIAISGNGKANQAGLGPSPTAISFLCDTATNSTGLRFANIFITYRPFATPQSSTLGLAGNSQWWGVITAALTAGAGGRPRIMTAH